MKAYEAEDILSQNKLWIQTKNKVINILKECNPGQPDYIIMELFNGYEVAFKIVNDEVTDIFFE